MLLDTEYLAEGDANAHRACLRCAAYDSLPQLCENFAVGGILCFILY